MNRCSVLFFMVAFISLPAFCLDLSYGDYTLRLDGPIEKGDLRKIVGAVSGSRGFPKYFTLNSPGGDIVEAMRIGRFIREMSTDTFVSDTCASACVLVLIAGASQSTLENAKVGIHRPYFGKEYFAGLSLREAEEKYKEMQLLAKQYLSDMEAPTWMIEQMFSIPSDDVYFLNPVERKQLRASPAAYSEWIRARCNPPTASEWKRFNIFDEPSPNTPRYQEFQEFKRKYESSIECEDALRREARSIALKKYR